jgi:hypothetical protein
VSGTGARAPDAPGVAGAPLAGAAAPGPPIACGLDAISLSERVREWRDFVASSVVSLDARTTSLRLVLEDSERALLAASSLAQREKQCCPFFVVTIEVEADRRTLVFSVPDGAEEALASFVAAVTP